MNPTNSTQLLWSELLCCIKCKEGFSKAKLPVNLACGHIMCNICTEIQGVVCPFDKNEIKSTAEFHYVNGPLLSIIVGKVDPIEGTLKSFGGEDASQSLEKIEEMFYSLANCYLCKISCEKGLSISSTRISRTIQRKLLSILCANVLTMEGKTQMINILCSMAERIVSELILHIQSNSNLSSSLWTAVRSRGCQFLGPAMQQDVLEIIHWTMQEGVNLERKTLVLYIVEKLTPKYMHVSKTCVGHVVQLLYRASCFNVIKREGKSSQMQLKEQFRNYQALRAEHDSQIVQIAMEAGLRISPDQWSSLLYGDCKHRMHMQLICDRLNDDSLKRAVEELQKIVSQQPEERDLFGISDIFEHLEAIIDHKIETLTAKDLDWAKIINLLEQTKSILSAYSKYIHCRNIERQQHRQMAALGDRTNKTPHQFVPFEIQQQSACRQQHGGRYPRMAANGGPNSMEIPFGNRPMPLLPPSQPLGLMTTTNYIAGNPSMNMPTLGCSPPNFLGPPMSMSTMQLPIASSPPPNFALPPLPLSITPPPISINQQDSGIGPSLELMTAVVPIVPQQIAATTISMPIPSTSPTLFTNGPSIILFSNGTGPAECTTMANGTTTIFTPTQPQNGNAPAQLFSTTPPTYQITPPYPIPIQQPQQLIVYGSTPPGPFGFGSPPGPFGFGSPPLLFPHWVNTQMETTTATLNPGLKNLFYTDGLRGYFGEAPVETEEENNIGKQRHQSPRSIIGPHDDGADNHECHVSFLVATSVLSDDKLGNSGGSSWTLVPPGNVSIPLSPAKTTLYAVAQVPSDKSNNLCTLTMNSPVSSLIEGGPSLVVPSIHELNISKNHLSISS